MEELVEGVTWWTARHPEWTEADGGEDGWAADVACLKVELADATLLIDPLLPAPDERAELIDGLLAAREARRPVEILISSRWHLRDAEALRDVLAARVWADPVAAAALDGVVTDVIEGAEPVPGLELIASGRPETGELLAWLPGPGVLFAGDILLDGPDGRLRLMPQSWCDASPALVDWRDRLPGALARVAALPVRVLVPSHGAPRVGAAAIDAIAAAIAAG